MESIEKYNEIDRIKNNEIDRKKQRNLWKSYQHCTGLSYHIILAAFFVKGKHALNPIISFASSLVKDNQ